LPEDRTVLNHLDGCNPALSATTEPSACRLVVFSDLNPAGGAYANGRCPKFTVLVFVSTEAPSAVIISCNPVPRLVVVLDGLTPVAGLPELYQVPPTPNQIFCSSTSSAICNTLPTGQENKSLMTLPAL